MFDWSRTRKYGLLWGKQQYWPLLSHLSEEGPQNTGKVLLELGSNRSALGWRNRTVAVYERSNCPLFSIAR